MSGEFSITADIELDLIRIRMSGFFDADDISRFVEARAEAHARLTCSPNQHLTLNDLRGMRIQAQDIVENFRQILADPTYRSRRLAFVIEPGLARNQLKRIIVNRNARYFDTQLEAEAWLLLETGSD